MKKDSKKLIQAQLLADVMIDAGLLDIAGYQAQVDEIMGWNEEGMQTMGRVIERHIKSKL